MLPFDTQLVVNKQLLFQLITDRMFSIDTEKSIRLQAQAAKSDIYYYIFAYNLEMPHFPPGMPKGLRFNYFWPISKYNFGWISGAVHGDDARLVFKMFMTPSVLKKQDEAMMIFFLDFLVGFAKSG